MSLGRFQSVYLWQVSASPIGHRITGLPDLWRTSANARWGLTAERQRPVQWFLHHLQQTPAIQILPLSFLLLETGCKKGSGHYSTSSPTSSVSHFLKETGGNKGKSLLLPAPISCAAEAPVAHRLARRLIYVREAA